MSERTELRTLAHDAAASGYALPAFNVTDQAGVDAVLAASGSSKSPVIVQFSTRAARFWGPSVVFAGFAARVAETGVVALLHLDHCGDAEFVLQCLRAGWDSALYDASALPYPEAVRTTENVVSQANELGRVIEGEFEPITKVGDAQVLDQLSSVDQYLDFADRTGVHWLSPDLGTQHGLCPPDPMLRLDLARELATRIPLVLHGGSGLSASCLRSAVGAGVAKVNFSTVVKRAYLTQLREVAADESAEPLTFAQRLVPTIAEICAEYMTTLGSAGRTT